jgi:nitroreductase
VYGVAKLQLPASAAPRPPAQVCANGCRNRSAAAAEEWQPVLTTMRPLASIPVDSIRQSPSAMNEQQRQRFEMFAEVARARRSVRGFLPTPVPQPVLERIFAIAQTAPSNCNTQPWHTCVVGGATRDRLAATIQAAAQTGDFTLDYPFDSGLYRDRYKTRQFDAALQLYGAMGIDRTDKPARDAARNRNYQLFGAPQLALIFMAAFGGVREAADVGMFAQNLMLALTAHGIASCPQTALGFFAEPVRRELDIGPEWKLLFGISFGYEDGAEPANRARVGRAPLSETTRFFS